MGFIIYVGKIDRNKMWVFIIYVARIVKECCDVGVRGEGEGEERGRRRR